MNTFYFQHLTRIGESIKNLIRCGVTYKISNKYTKNVFEQIQRIPIFVTADDIQHNRFDIIETLYKINTDKWNGKNDRWENARWNIRTSDPNWYKKISVNILKELQS